MTFARTGTRQLPLVATFSATAVSIDYVIASPTFQANFVQQLDTEVRIRTATGLSPAEAPRRIQAALMDFPNVDIHDRAEEHAAQQKQVNLILVPVTALLLLSAIIALMGIANTLVLSIHERTREIGLLRAVGMARNQLRVMIRSKAVIVSCPGGLLGFAVAVSFGCVLVLSLGDLGVTELRIPLGQLLAWVVVTALDGLTAGILPARRAAQLDILRALGEGAEGNLRVPRRWSWIVEALASTPSSSARTLCRAMISASSTETVPVEACARRSSGAHLRESREGLRADGPRLCMTENEPMRVRLLGGFEIEGVLERDLGSRKGRTLLKMLAVARGRPVSVDRIADALWGDNQPSHPADQVGVLVSRLRGVLGSERIVRTDAGYLLVAEWVDVDELSELAATASKALDEDRVVAARAAAGAALALARGPLLPEEEGEWVEAERRAIGSVVSRVERLAVDAAVAAGDHGAAAAAAEQALARDPYDEVVLRSLMRSHLAAGRPSSALAAYARTRRHLAQDLGVPPTAETEALYADALAAADGDLAPAPPLRRPVQPGLVGRASELAELDASLAGVAGGGVGLVVVEGEAGMGKTTLVRAWADVIGQDAVVLYGRCDELGRDLPLQPVADALADHLRNINAERAGALIGDDAATLAPLLGPIAGATATVVADADAARTRVFGALAAAVSRSGGGLPVVAVVEDLHVAGGGTLAWLAFAGRRCHRTLLVVTTRPGGAKDLEATCRIRLGPLDRHAVAALVGSERAGALYARSGGHPLLLAALAGAEDEDVPATLREAVGSRVDALGEDVAATLRVAAVLGPECDLDLLAQVAGTPVVDLLAQLEAAAKAGLLVERGDGFAFRHQLFREALEAATGAARRALVHQVAARALAGRPHADSLDVAIHARAGGDRALASSAFVAAARAAAARFDVDAAELHLEAALDLAPAPEALVARARLRMSRAAYGAAAADAERAIATGGGAAALEVAGWVAYYRRRYDEARAYADEAAARAEDDAVRVSALALAGRVRHGAGDLPGAVEQLTAVHGGPPAVRGVADVWLAHARVHQGRPADALVALARPMVDPDSLAHPFAPLHLRFSRILALGQLGRASDALRVADDLDAALDRTGSVGARFAGPAANVRAWVLRWSGRVGEADEHNWRAVDAAGGDTGPSGEAMAEGYYAALLDLADGCLLRGEADGASVLAGRLAAVDTWQGTMAWHQRHRVGLLRARLALVGGDPAAAAELARAVAADAARRGAARYELLAHAVVGLADRSVPDEQLAPVVDGLDRCAVMDGWPLVLALATARRSERWRAEAERRAAAVVAAAGAHGDAARRFVDRVFSG